MQNSEAEAIGITHSSTQRKCSALLKKANHALGHKRRGKGGTQNRQK
jgi:hypothetical protein